MTLPGNDDWIDGLKGGLGSLLREGTDQAAASNAWGVSATSRSAESADDGKYFDALAKLFLSPGELPGEMIDALYAVVEVANDSGQERLLNAVKEKSLNLSPEPDGQISHMDYAMRVWLADRLRRFVAGTDVFSKQSDGSTVAGQYAKLGISLRPANMERVNGWAEILQRLGDVEAGVTPRLFIHGRCARLIECLPALQHDPNRPEDMLKVDADEDGIGGDDPADALRYLVATKARAVTQRKLRGL